MAAAQAALAARLDALELPAGGFTAALGHLVELGAQVIHQRAHGGGVGQKVRRAGVELGVENGHTV